MWTSTGQRANQYCSLSQPVLLRAVTSTGHFIDQYWLHFPFPKRVGIVNARKEGRSSSLPAEEVTRDPPADDTDDEEAEGQRMLEDAPEAGGSLGEELRVAVE